MLKTAKERRKHKYWIGPCCKHPHPSSYTSSSPPSTSPPSTTPPSTSPPSNPPPQSTPPPQPPPPPPPTHTQPPQNNLPYNKLNILQININGLAKKFDELLYFMNKHKVHIAAIQETKFTDKTKIQSTPKYTLVQKDRQINKGGGVAFLIHESVYFKQDQTPIALVNDPHLESLTITIQGKNDSLQICNVYIPPTSSCQNQYEPDIESLFVNTSDNALILGDFNAHNSLWFSDSTDNIRGNRVADLIGNRPLGILNEDLPTRVTEQCQSSPDISIATSNLLPTCSWTVHSALNSDHLPIIITLNTKTQKVKAEDKTFVNVSKANWDGFSSFTEEIFARIPKHNNVIQSEKSFRNILNKAAKKYIPAGRIPNIIHEIPTEAANLIDKRDQMKAANPSDNRIPNLNREIDQKIDEHRKKKWHEHLDTCDPGSKQLWTTIQSLSGKPNQPNNEAIHFNNKPVSDRKKIASRFNSQYTPCASTKPTKPFRKILRNLKKRPKDQKINITTEQVQEAIKKSKNSKALGPDKISAVMLKHVGPHGISYLTNIFNHSLNQGIIPALWKTGRIIPILKPGKPSDQGKSYRPISLLSPLAKTLESILLPIITKAIPFASHQHGFRKGHSTTTALQEINNHIDQGLNQKRPVERTVSVAIDLSQAFDTVNHKILLEDINNLVLNDYIKRWLTAYIRGRQTFVEFRGRRSKFRKMRQGVPQGGVLSPVLFNLYMSKMPSPPGKIKLVSYADDSNVLNSGRKLDPICQELNAYLATLDDWFCERNLFISPAKSTATVFTTWGNECSAELDIKINGVTVPTVKHPKFLGIVFDNLHTFNQHASYLKSRVQSRNNILKSLAGTTWGKDKETLLTTYKAIGQSVINYSCPIWTPNLKQTNWDSIQVAQNSALRPALGCVNKTAISHLHAESKVMPVKDHCEMLSKQFLLATQKEDHPNNCDLNTPTVPRVTKKTLQIRFGDYIKDIHPHDTALEPDDYKMLLKRIHTESVNTTISNFENNKVLNELPPPINDAEKELPRRTRCLLSQLRSGYSSMLNSYLSVVDINIEDKCPNCHQISHTTEHLFNCPSAPTELTPKSLWTKPLEAAQFLGLDTGITIDDHG